MINGKVRVGLQCSGERKEWESFMIATWSATLHVSAQPSGNFVVSISDQAFAPEFRHPDHDARDSAFDIETLRNVFQQFQGELQNAVDVDYIVRGMTAFFTDITTQLRSDTQHVAMNPWFNRNGDLIFEIRFNSAYVEESHKAEDWEHVADYELDDEDTLEESEKSSLADANLSSAESSASHKARSKSSDRRSSSSGGRFRAEVEDDMEE